MTSHGRTKHFAPFEDSRQEVDAVRRQWIRVSGEQVAPIVGIFIDLVNYNSDSFWNVIGFTRNGEHHRYDKNDPAKVPAIPEVYAATARAPKPFQASHGESRFILWTASLNNISSLQIRRREGRCMGLLIRYRNATAETLGQWDPFDQGSISQLYDASDGILMRINFHISRKALYYLQEYQGMRVNIKEITVEVTDNPWEFEAPKGQPAGEDLLIKTFDCYRPNQVSKPLSEITYT